MDKFVIDKEKAQSLAKSIGLEISFDSPTPGVLIKNDQNEIKYSFSHFFTEFGLTSNHSSQNKNFITKEEGILEKICPKVKKAKNRVVKVGTKFKNLGKLFKAS